MPVSNWDFPQICLELNLCKFQSVLKLDFSLVVILGLGLGYWSESHWREDSDGEENTSEKELRVS